MKRLTALLLALMLALSAVPALADTWYCPECGTKCDNNFCPECGTPKPANIGAGRAAPAPGLKFEKTVLNADGSFTIAWSGGKAPYKLDYMWYVNADHNEGADVTRWIAVDDCYDFSVDLRYDLVPGERYWLILTDADGSRVWLDYASPRKNFSAFSKTRMVLSLRTRINSRASTVKNFSAAEIQRDYQKNLYGVTCKMEIGGRNTDYTFTARMVIFLPDGEPLLFYCQENTISRRATYAYWETLDMSYAWEMLIKMRGDIPAGQYTWRLYADDELFGQSTFTIR